MSTLPLTINGNRARGWALWVVPAVALAALVGWEIDWGRQLVRMPSAPPPVESKPVTAAALPEYRIEGGLPAHAEMVARTLFNATRRPAPVLASDGPRRLNPGRFQLVGTTVTAERNVAFLKEVAGGKSRVVRQGDEIDGVYVASVTPDRVKLTLGNESEELILKVAQGPKTTLAAAPPPPGAPAVAAPAAAAAPAAQARAQAAAVPNAAEVRPQDARQARRAARAAQEAAAMSGQGSDTSAQGGRKPNR